MLKITVPGVEHFDEEHQEFVTQGDFDLELEHSLVSLSKWESIYEKPFLGDSGKSNEEVVGYVKAMTLGDEVPEEVYSRLSKDNFDAINAYIDAKMTATWFHEVEPESNKKEIVTSELIYFWMIGFQIPFECENWHLNRLFTLIRVCSIKNSKPKKMSRAQIAERNRRLNAERRKRLQSQG